MYGYKSLWLLSMASLLLFSVSCGGNGATDEPREKPSSSRPLVLFAAAGTRPATNEICDAFEKKTGIRVERNFASSGTLARQIASGAEADVFVSANQQWMDFLSEKKMLKNDSIQTIAGNSLVVIAPADSTVRFIDFTPSFDIAAMAEHIAVGDPAYVPVGKYTDAAFRKLRWADRLKGKLIRGKDVSAVLQYVELGECELGVVYRSEALASSRVKIIAEIPTSLHDPIVFYVAELKSVAAADSAHQLRNMFLKEGMAIFRKRGFQPVEP